MRGGALREMRQMGRALEVWPTHSIGAHGERSAARADWNLNAAVGPADDDLRGTALVHVEDAHGAHAVLGFDPPFAFHLASNQLVQPDGAVLEGVGKAIAAFPSLIRRYVLQVKYFVCLCALRDNFAIPAYNSDFEVVCPRDNLAFPVLINVAHFKRPNIIASDGPELFFAFVVEALNGTVTPDKAQGIGGNAFQDSNTNDGDSVRNFFEKNILVLFHVVRQNMSGRTNE